MHNIYPCNVFYISANSAFSVFPKYTDIAVRRSMTHFPPADSKQIRIKVLQVQRSENESSLVARAIGDQLEKRVAFRKAIRQTTQMLQKSGVKGFKIQVSGRDIQVFGQTHPVFCQTNRVCGRKSKFLADTSIFCVKIHAVNKQTNKQKHKTQIIYLLTKDVLYHGHINIFVLDLC